MTTAARTDDEEAVHALAQRMGQAWSAGDADAYGACFTADATYIAFNGTLAEGRDAITEGHRWLFAGPLKGTRLGSDSGGHTRSVVRFVHPDVAHMISIGGMIAHPDDDQPDPGHDSTVSLLAVREEGGWRFAAFQNTRRADGAR